MVKADCDHNMQEYEKDKAHDLKKAIQKIDRELA
jgi:hypothetical protein